MQAIQQVVLLDVETWDVRFHEQTTSMRWRVIEWGAVMIGLCWLFIRLWVNRDLPRRERLRPRSPHRPSPTLTWVARSSTHLRVSDVGLLPPPVIAAREVDRAHQLSD